MAFDWMAEAGKFGESIFDSAAEGLDGLIDGVIDYQNQKRSQTLANPQVQKEAEPVKGKTVDGRPIVASLPVMGGLTTTQLMMIAGGIGLLGVVLVASRG